MIKFNDLIIYFYLFLLPISLVIGLVEFKRTRNQAFLVLCVYTLSMIVIHVTGELVHYYYFNNLFLSHFYFLAQLCTFGWFYHLAFKKNVKQQHFVKIYLGSVLSIMLIVFATQPQKFFSFNYTEIFLCYYFMVFCALLFIYNTIGKKTEFTWINYAVLSYSFIACVHFMFQNLYTRIGFSNVYMLALHNVAILLLQSVIIIELSSNHLKKLKWTK